MNDRTTSSERERFDALLDFEQEMQQKSARPLGEEKRSLDELLAELGFTPPPPKRWRIVRRMMSALIALVAFALAVAGLIALFR